MISIQNKKNCFGCYACVNICPKKCIIMKKDDEGFFYPKIDKDVCINCGLCNKICPIINKTCGNIEYSTQAIAAVNNNIEIVKRSSSGGIFSHIAEEIINNNGVVFGAAFSNDFYSVSHIFVEDIEGLKKLRGSKYVQSNIGNSYIKAKEFLEAGRLVLFTGTPCQIGGLKAFLKKDYDNLYTQDLVCHGVPSPLVWKKYLEYQEKKFDAKIINVNFRCKKHGWKNYCMALEFSNGKEIYRPINDDWFMRGFVSNLYLRPSCYTCNFKGIKRQSDITLADFWGIERIYPKMFDDFGVSLVLLHSEKGKSLIQKNDKNIRFISIDYEEAIKYNSSAVKSSNPNNNRKIFMEEMEKHPQKAFKKYCGKTLKEKVKFVIKKLIKLVMKRSFK